MEADCIPAGMELFPAAGDDQLEFIKSVIDESDYFVLLLAGRYGSTATDGVGFTEKEYDYAVEQRKEVLAFVHADTSRIESGKTEQSEEGRQKLEAFRKKIMSGILVKHWKSPEELHGLIISSVIQAIRRRPGVGWIRGDKAASEELLQEINLLRKEREELLSQLDGLNKDTITPPDLAGLDEQITLHGSCTPHGRSSRNWTATFSWKELFGLLAPYLLSHPSDQVAKAHVKSICLDRYSGGDGKFISSEMNDLAYQKVKTQFLALGLVDLPYLKNANGHGFALFWVMTPRGKELMMRESTVKTLAATIE
jgi:hypothetical protein